MNILVVSESSWNDKDSLGNTLNNWFSGWNDNFYHFFTRKLCPNNDVVKMYYNLSSKDIIKGFFRFNICGKTFSKDDICNMQNYFEKESLNEQKTINRVHSKKNKTLYYLNDFVWNSKIWFNKHTKRFLESIKPDIIFALSKSANITKPIASFCKKRYGTKLVVFAADEMYSQYKNELPLRRKSLIRRFQWILKSADLLYTASESMSFFYLEKFGISASVITKGCDLSMGVQDNKSKDRLNLVYAGNLLYGRDDVLVKICNAVQIHNDNKESAIHIDIITISSNESALQKFIPFSSFVTIYHSMPYEMVKKKMNSAHYVLMAESFDSSNVQVTRCSFSTKVIDCLQSGSGILNVGPTEIETIRFLSHIDGVITVDSLEKLKDTLSLIADNYELSHLNALKIREFASTYYGVDSIRNRMINDFNEMFR